MLAFAGYGFVYFFGLLPTKVWALFTLTRNTWGTSARTQSERKKTESFRERSFHVAYLCLWFFALAAGLGFYLSVIAGSWLCMLVLALPIPFSVNMYVDDWSWLSLTSKSNKQLSTEKVSVQAATSTNRVDPAVHNIDNAAPAIPQTSHHHEEKAVEQHPAPIEVPATTDEELEFAPTVRYPEPAAERLSALHEVAERPKPSPLQDRFSSTTQTTTSSRTRSQQWSLFSFRHRSMLSTSSSVPTTISNAEEAGGPHTASAHPKSGKVDLSGGNTGAATFVPIV